MHARASARARRAARALGVPLAHMAHRVRELSAAPRTSSFDP